MHTKYVLVSLLGVVLFGAASGSQASADTRRTSGPLQAAATAAAPNAAAAIYLPLVANMLSRPRVNVPHFPVADIFPTYFDEMAIIWLGRVTPTENYADVRVGFSTTGLEVRVGVFDRLLWFDETPSAGSLEAWDAVTVYLNLDGASGNMPDDSSYRFVGQLNFLLNFVGARSAWQTAYRGNGSGWVSVATPFTTTTAWRGNSPNDGINDRGWINGFKIPYSSLGLEGPPAEGTVWGFAVTVHDRDDAAGTPIADQHWPQTANSSEPASWAELRYGLATYSAPGVTITHTATIREGLAGANVPDAGVGGAIGNLCPGNEYHIWNEWGNLNYGSARAFNVQNQRDIADWPCFAKYYVTFPLSSIPRGYSIISATLTLYHWGNSGDSRPGQSNSASPSFVQVLTVPANWTEDTLTWNNAPLPLENVAQAWVPVNPGCLPPCIPRNWDVSYAVAKALAQPGPISFAVYSSDAAYHSGKFFTASEQAPQDAIQHPTLTVVWGEP
jgi:hypothetical protein